MIRNTTLKVIYSICTLLITLNTFGKESLFVTTAEINYRSRPVVMDRNIISVLPKGDTIRVDEIDYNDSDGWVKVLNKTHLGYVNTKYLSKIDSVLVEENYYPGIKGTNLLKATKETALKFEPKPLTTSIDTIKKGEIVEYIRSSDKFYRIKYNGEYRWVYKKNFRKYVKLKNNLSLGSFMQYIMELGWRDWIFYLITFITITVFFYSQENNTRNLIFTPKWDFIVTGISWGALTAIFSSQTLVFFYKAPLIGIGYGIVPFLLWLSIPYLIIKVVFKSFSLQRNFKIDSIIPTKSYLNISFIMFSFLMGFSLFIGSFIVMHRIIETIVIHIWSIVGFFFVIAIIVGFFTDKSGTSSSSSKDNIKNGNARIGVTGYIECPHAIHSGGSTRCSLANLCNASQGLADSGKECAGGKRIDY